MRRGHDLPSALNATLEKWTEGGERGSSDADANLYDRPDGDGNTSLEEVASVRQLRDVLQAN